MEECFYFVDNDLVQIRYVFLQNYLLVLSLLKSKDVRNILELKKIWSKHVQSHHLKSNIE